MIPIGRKGSYAEWLTDDGLLRVQGWARDGLTDEQIAHNIGICSDTFYEWLKRFPEFSETIKKGRAPVDIEVENALLKRAKGYEYEETVTEIYKGADGVERQHVRKIKKHMPAETAAGIFWLKNRKASRWRDRVNELPESSTNELLQSLMELERTAGEND